MYMSNFVAGALAASLVSGYDLQRAEKTAGCCAALSKSPSLKDKVYYPDSATYEARIDSYWSHSAALEPWCMVLPSTAEDASEFIKIIVADDCPFGIRSGGHGIFPLSSSVKNGITIDFGRMNQTTYNPDSKLASLQPGGNWGSVYQALEPHGVAVAGGRGSVVGVAGFLLGGGNSFFNSAYGWACDSVHNFEVVLADGRVVNASAAENRDLWIALRGGSGNFGLVTRFDVETIPYADPNDPVIWGGAVLWGLNATDGLIDAIAEFADAAADDVYSTSFCMWIYQKEKWYLGCSLNNVVNKPDAPAFDVYKAVSDWTSDTLRSDTLYNLTAEQNGEAGYYNIWMTGAYKNDRRVMHFAVKKQQEAVERLKETIPDDKVLSNLLQFQPITVPMVSHGQGLNSLGLDDEIADGPGIMTNFLIQIETAEAEAAVYPIALEFQREIDDYAASIGADWEWRYLNYADLSVDPIARYGEESVRRLEAASAKYDPDGVFQKLRESGHKLPH